MKKVIKSLIYVIPILSLIIIFNMNNFSLSKIINQTEKNLSTKEIIINNLQELKNKNKEDFEYDYRKDKKYKEIINFGEEAISIIQDLNKNKELDESTGHIAVEIVQEISNYNLKEEYDLEINNPEQFFKIWNSIKRVDEQNRKNITKDVLILLDKYPNMATTIYKSNIKMPELEQMIPQGLTITQKNIIITAYDKTGETNSKCYILNKKGLLEKIVTLDTNSHVGAIAYDKINNLLWIPVDDGHLNAYDLNEFNTKNEVKYKYSFEDVGDHLKNYENKLKNLIAYLCIKDNKLFIGSFDDKEKGLVKEYEIIKEKNNEITLNYLKEFKVLPQVQGIELYEYKDESYLILSCSYGRFNSSYIHIYKYKEDTTDYGSSLIQKVTLKMPPMLEQITKEKKSLYILFESNAKEYSNCLEKIEYICVLDLDKIFAFWDELEKENQIKNNKKEVMQ